jgi:ribosome-associated protein
MPAEIARCVEAALEKKAEDLVVLDLRGLSDVTDFFVICHGTSDRHVLALKNAVEEQLHRHLGISPSSVEGTQRAEWVLLDYIDFVVHIFVEERRAFYRLENLWGDAPRIEVPMEGEGAAREGSGA